MSTQATGPSEPPETRPGHLLVVDDDPDIRLILGLALAETAGRRLSLCASGAEALERARRDAPDLVVLDVTMASLDGLDTCRALRALPGLAEVPVVFLTARVDPAEHDRLLDLGARGVLTKPFDPNRLEADLLGLWHDDPGTR